MNQLIWFSGLTGHFYEMCNIYFERGIWALRFCITFDSFCQSVNYANASSVPSVHNQYFLETNYIANGHCFEWAAWARKCSTVNVNMHVESYHKTLKHSVLYLKKKQNNRIDYLLDVLMKVNDDQLLYSIVKKHRKSDLSSRIKLLHVNHRKSESIDCTKIVQQEKNVWRFPASDGKKFYLLRWIRKNFFE